MSLSHVPPAPTTLTWTGVRTFRSCPRRFSKRYVEMLAEIAAAELERGSGVHEILEFLGRASFDGRELEPGGLTLLVEKYAAVLVAEAADDLRAIVKRYMAKGALPTFPSDATDVGFERPFAIDADGAPVEWDDPTALFRSIWDQFYRENGGTLAVVRDFKTSRVIENPGEQMRVYAWAACCLFPDVEEVVVELHFVRYGDCVRRGTFRREELAVVLEELRAVRASVVDRRERNDWTARASLDCLDCSFAEGCPAMEPRLVPLRLVTREDFEAAAEADIRNQVEAARVNAQLRAYCTENGPQSFRGEEIGFVESVEHSAVASIAAGVLTEHGVTDDEIWAAVSLPSDERKKLVTKAIKSAPKKEKAAARERVEQEFRDAGALVAETVVKFKRARAKAETPAE